MGVELEGYLHHHVTENDYLEHLNPNELQDIIQDIVYDMIRRKSFNINAYISYNFGTLTSVNEISFFANYGAQLSINKFKLSVWNQETNQWVDLDREYKIGWTSGGNTELGETQTVSIDPVATTAIKIRITEARLYWRQLVLREIEFHNVIR
ncbi:MAG: hypothetical protein ACK5JH_09290 [Anaerocolumna sp.]